MEVNFPYVSLEVFYIFIIFMKITLSQDEEKSTLRLVQILYRHGDRSPTHGYPNDPVKESDWPQGYGQLSKLGMDQEYRLGQSIQNLYIKKLGFLPVKYNRTKVFVRSTDIDRTLMSAYCVLAGLYPSLYPTQAWNNSWQPIPVHTVPLTEDYLLSSHAVCHLLDKLHQEFLAKNQQLKDLTEQKQWLIHHISRNTGLPPTIDSVFDVQDPLFCENRHKKIDPTTGWLAVNRTFEEIMALRDVPNNLLVPTPQMARLRSGVLLTEMISNMKAKTKQALDRDIILYSAHDDTVVALLSVLKYYRYPEFPGVQPQYSTSVVLELHEQTPENFVVKIFLRNVTNSTDLHLYPIPIQGCEVDCPFPQFITLLSDMTVKDIKTECQVDSQSADESVPKPDSADSYVGVGILAGLLGLLIVMLAGTCWMYRKQDQNTAYRPIPLTEEP
uniref:acid phosphatase n=1 Tax=Crassostrea virginica TaxID=6565 RepID=A0A8B8BJL0_CRAVI|nr:lysosomal acid phosphatase-like [Crassostrea virginica]